MSSNPIRRPPPQSVRELGIRAEALAGRCIGELAEALQCPLPADPSRAKGFVGNLVELALGADPTAGDNPDFLRLGVELKTVPVDRAGRPVESTFCCSITMASADREHWESSRLRRRLAKVLWLPVEAARLAPLPDRRFGSAALWSPNEAESSLIRADWEDLIGAIGAGRPPSADVGKILQVRPKAANSAVRTLAPAEVGVDRVLPLGFYLRREFTAKLLRSAADLS